MRSVPPERRPRRLGARHDHRQVGHLSRLIDDLLDVSRITLGKVELRQQTLDIAVIAAQALEADPAGPDRSEASQIVVALPSEPTFVRGDAVRLTQVIANLLDNAGKYTNGGGQVTMRVAARRSRRRHPGQPTTGWASRRRSSGTCSTCSSQGAATRGRAGGGLGIGLTLVKRIVALHGGSVRATSGGDGRGSEFVVRIPALTAAAVREKTPTRGGHAGAATARSARLPSDPGRR